MVLEFPGTGLVLPFPVVYLNEVRDFSLGDVGLLLARPPLVGFLSVGPGGSAGGLLVDVLAVLRVEPQLSPAINGVRRPLDGSG